MAASVTYTVDDMKRKIADLLMECAVRAAHEDELLAQIAERDARILELGIKAAMAEKPRIEEVPVKAGK